MEKNMFMNMKLKDLLKYQVITLSWLRIAALKKMVMTLVNY